MFKKIIGLGFPSKGKNAKDIEKYVKELVVSGANEFFTGYNPDYWHEKFGFEVSPNGRFAEHEQITDFEVLKKVVEEVHTYKIEIFANLNAWYYTAETMPYIKQMVDEFIKVGIDGIICGNIGALEYLKHIQYPGKINISTILAVYNSEAIRFMLDNYKVNKVILSREITLKEIEKLVTEFPNLKFEVFGEGDFCRYNNGLCFAEHKYGARDICTVVVNDLIVKKRFRPDFKKIIIDIELLPSEKGDIFLGKYEDIFEEIEDTFEKISLGMYDEDTFTLRLGHIVMKNRKREDLFFDALCPITNIHNKRLITFLKALKFFLGTNDFLLISKSEQEDLHSIKDEIERSIKTGIKFLTEKTEAIGGIARLKAHELKNFYAKGDSLNLYSYLFFSKFPNIETVKFPTRGRDYAEKLAIIEKVLQIGKIDDSLLDRGVSPERTHYDLSYIFGDKQWFRKLLNDKHYSEFSIEGK